MPAAPHRLLRSAAAGALAFSATGVLYAAAAPPARAAGYDGACTSSSGVTVVVDFGPLGGGVATRCSPVGSGATGIDALQAAGIPVAGTQRYGLAFVCRLYGEPTSARTLPGGYHEQCVNTPPTDAHWDYFKAANGGSWSYSSTGASGSAVIPGGFEGWRFSEGSRIAPGRAPVRATAKPKPKPTATHTTTRPAAPRHTTTHPAAPRATTSPARPAATHAGSTGHTTRATSSAPAHSRTHAAHSSAAPHGSHRATPTSRAASSASASTSTSTSTGAAVRAGGPAAPDSDKLIHDSQQSSGVTTTTAVGGGVLAALAIGGTVVTIVRRRTLG